LPAIAVVEPENGQPHKKQCRFNLAAGLDSHVAVLFYLDSLLNNNQETAMQHKTFTVSRNVFIMRMAVWIPITLVTFGVALPALIYFLIDSLCTKLTVTKEGLSTRTGWLFVSHKEIPFSRMNNIDVTTTPLGDWWHYAHISVSTGNDKITKFRCIDNAQQLKKLLIALSSKHQS
jgi:membrane protein YdbS with pleckstrin-like domain